MSCKDAKNFLLCGFASLRETSYLRYSLFYTGTNHQENGLIQRIGSATSTNLIDWQKQPQNPLIVANPQWHEILELAGRRRKKLGHRLTLIGAGFICAIDPILERLVMSRQLGLTSPTIPQQPATLTFSPRERWGKCRR